MSDRAPLEPGSCYLIEEKRPEVSYRLFSTLVASKTPGLVITRQHPARMRQELNNADAGIIWLSHTPGEDFHNPTAIGTLAKVIQKFIEDNGGEGVVLLDGLEYMVINNGFLQTLMFVEHVNEFVMQRKAVLLLPVDPDALEAKELALLKRSINVFAPTMSKIVIRLIPSSTEVVEECQLLRNSFAVSSDIDDSLRPLEQRLREAQRSRVPFVVLVSEGEARSGILHVIDYRGRERWMSLENLQRAIIEWESVDR
jgi:hypothetical protein